MITVCLLYYGHAHARGDGMHACMHHTCTMRRCRLHACVKRPSSALSSIQTNWILQACSQEDTVKCCVFGRPCIATWDIARRADPLTLPPAHVSTAVVFAIVKGAMPGSAADSGDVWDDSGSGDGHEVLEHENAARQQVYHKVSGVLPPCWSGCPSGGTLTTRLMFCQFKLLLACASLRTGWLPRRRGPWERALSASGLQHR